MKKTLTKFFEGLSGLPADLREWFDSVWLDLFAAETQSLTEWETEFALPDTDLTEQERRDRIDAAWQATGGQSPRYIQDVLQANGFPVYIHEWWVPGSEPAVGVQACATARDPNTYIVPPAYLLVNKIATVSRKYIAFFGGDNQFGKSDSQFGRFDEFLLSEVDYPIPTDPACWPYILYIGGETFPALASIPAIRRDEFEFLCRKICPAQQWLGILVNYT